MDLRNKYNHLTSKKPQYLLYKYRPIDCGAKQKIVQPTDTSPSLYDKGIKRVKAIFGALIYVVRSVNNKLLVTLIEIGSQQAVATEETADAIEQLLDYVLTCPDDGIIFRKSDMILAAHADAGLLNESKARIRSGAHIFFLENNPNPKRNGPTLTISKIIKSVIASADEAKMAALNITDKDETTT